MPSQKMHYAFIGVSVVNDDYPLLCDAINEKGLGIAGLNFQGPNHYFPKIEGKKNIASFELMPYLLSNCENTDDVKEILDNANILNISFSANYPAADLH